MRTKNTTTRCRAGMLIASLAAIVASACTRSEPRAGGMSVSGAAARDDVDRAAYAASGATLYARVCAACHGPQGAGRKGLGKTLANSAFVQGLDDETLLAFIKRGRYPGDPENTTGVGMPAKGGSPSLSEDDLLDIIAYLRTLQEGGDPASAGD